MSTDELLAEQRRYYAERAPDYEDWWWRRGRYALDVEAEAGWFADIAEVEDALRALAPLGDVLELAAGTGIWTRRLVELADRVVAVDANAEMLALNTAGAEHVVADAFAWEPTERFDLCLFSFWISHVPAARFEAFWSLVRSAVRPHGRVFLVDGAIGDREPSGEEERRTLYDGREFRIVKRFWTPAQLTELVRPLGFELELRETANGQFLYGSGR
ncbi:MAG TPA: class I SAM-dependent methyltransferase [Gaiellaceae bacterium]|nr:class I SAM-dependent methyltransferase [Gaiellaceae bacterium]